MHILILIANKGSVLNFKILSNCIMGIFFGPFSIWIMINYYYYHYYFLLFFAGWRWPPGLCTLLVTMWTQAMRSVRKLTHEVTFAQLPRSKYLPEDGRHKWPWIGRKKLDRCGQNKSNITPQCLQILYGDSHSFIYPQVYSATKIFIYI